MIFMLILSQIMIWILMSSIAFIEIIWQIYTQLMMSKFIMILTLHLLNWLMMLITMHMINMIVLFDLTSKNFYTCLISLSILSQWDLQNSELIFSSKFNLNEFMMLIIIFMQLHKNFAINEFSNMSNLLHSIKQLWWLFNNLQMSHLSLQSDLISRFQHCFYMMLLLWKTEDVALNLLVRKWFDSYFLSSLILKSQISMH